MYVDNSTKELLFCVFNEFVWWFMSIALLKFRCIRGILAISIKNTKSLNCLVRCMFDVYLVVIEQLHWLRIGSRWVWEIVRLGADFPCALAWRKWRINKGASLGATPGNSETRFYRRLAPWREGGEIDYLFILFVIVGGPYLILYETYKYMLSQHLEGEEWDNLDNFIDHSRGEGDRFGKEGRS